jgi:hypothetical protein
MKTWPPYWLYDPVVVYYETTKYKGKAELGSLHFPLATIREIMGYR